MWLRIKESQDLVNNSLKSSLVVKMVDKDYILLKWRLISALLCVDIIWHIWFYSKTRISNWFLEGKKNEKAKKQKKQTKKMYIM